MKKICVCFALLMAVSSLAFSYPESVLSLGFEYGTIFEKHTDMGDTVNTFMNSPGIAFHSYAAFKENWIGIFSHGFFGFPQTITVEQYGVKTEPVMDVMHIGLLIGPSYMYSFNEKLRLLVGIGFHWFNTFSYYTLYDLWLNKNIDVEQTETSLGIGAEIGINYKLTRRINLNAGCVLTYDFAKTIEVIITSDGRMAKGRADNFSALGIRPYVSIGFSFYAPQHSEY